MLIIGKGLRGLQTRIQGTRIIFSPNHNLYSLNPRLYPYSCASRAIDCCTRAWSAG